MSTTKIAVLTLCNDEFEPDPMDPVELLLSDDDKPAMPSATATVSVTLNRRRLRIKRVIGLFDSPRPDRSSLYMNNGESA